ncbi:MAG: hypothetical protein ACRYG8_16645 [Janthinobacterium lividum]
MMSGSQLIVRPEVGRAVARIISGAHFTCLLLDDKQQRATALEAVLDQVTDPNTRVVWVGNPLRSPLTIERFLIQIVGPEVDLRLDRTPAQLVKLMTQPVGDENRLLVIVQQPETMGAEARDTLAAVTGHLAGGTLQMQFLFVSSTNFTLMTITEPPVLALALPPVVTARRPFLTRLNILLPLALVLGAALGVSGTFAFTNMRLQLAELAGLAVPPVIAPVTPVASATPVTPTAPVMPVATAPATPAAPDLIALRREFDAFLAKRASITPPMTEAQKDALFRDFLSQHRRD